MKSRLLSVSLFSVTTLFLSVMLASAVDADSHAPKGFTAIFNGTDFSGWKVPEGGGGHWKILDGVIDYLPSPLDIPPIQGHLPQHDETAVFREASDDESFSALAFKIMTDSFVGKLTYARVYSGSLPAGSYATVLVDRSGHGVVLLDRDTRERGEQAAHLRARGRVPVDAAVALLEGHRGAEGERVIRAQQMA